MDSMSSVSLSLPIGLWMCLVTVYSHNCDDLLVSELPQTAFRSSSELSGSHSPAFAKINRRDGAGGWSPMESNRPQWLQIDLGERTEVTAVATQGRYGSSDWVTSYALMFSDSENNWEQYRQQDSIWAFPGNSNADSVAHHKLQHSIRARYIRFTPLQWNLNGRIGMRVEIYGCSYKSDVADFDGRSSLLYRFSQKTVSTVKDMISVQFRSTESEGVILHGEGQRGDYITLELNKGKLSLQINLGDTKLQSVNGHTSATLGSLLDDQHWHSVTIERYNKQVNFTVDQHTQHFRTRGEFDYLDIDYELSFGGIPVPGKSVTFLRKNFRGCLENLYYNGVNIIDLAKRRKPQIHILGNVSFSCWEAAVIPVTFGGLGSYLVLPGRPQMDGLSLSFQFRTWNGDGLLLYSQLPGTAGALRIRISHGKLHSNILKASRSQADIAAGADLNNGQWHSVSLNARRNRISLILDNNSASTFHSTTQNPIYSGSSYYFGGCPTNASSNECSNIFGNFQGCMRLILIDNQPVDLKLAQPGSQANFTDLLIDVCGIQDRCLPNYCEHGGECSQSWSTFHCDCTGTGYSGETCHGSLYEKSCEAYRHKGSPSDFFSIDPDGSGPLAPLLVYCNMTEEKTWIVVQHNNTELTRVQDSTSGKPQLVYFSYTANMEQLQALIDSMDHCEQNLAFHCRKSRLLNVPGEPPLTWWIGRTNEKQMYWGGASPGAQQCGCGLDRSCLDPHHGCNCDADRDQWANDTGLLSYKDHLPVTQLVFGDLNRTDSEAAYRLGPLRCYGDRSYWNAASFSSGSSYLHFPTFRGELSADISFFFKTTASSGVFLENLGIKDFIRLQLNSPAEVTFSFDVGNGPLEVRIRSPSRLNDNQWHHVRAERNIKAASLRVDHLPRQTLSSPADGHVHLQLNSQLFVGGTASRQRGFLGCMRAMRLNGESLDLEERATVTPGVTAGCPGHCSSYGNLCHNGGRCTERPNGYSCDCSQSPYNGPFCKAEISAFFDLGSSLVYTFQESYGISKNLSAHLSSIYTGRTPSPETTAFAFRTLTAPSLLLYVDSYRQEYLALTLLQNGSLQIRYRLDNEKDPDVFTTETGNLADGHVHSFKMDREGPAVSVEIDDLPTMNYKLSSVTDTVFNSLRSLVLGKILDAGDMDRELLIANAHGFVGCLSSVRFNWIAPLKARLRQPGPAPVQVRGRVVESDCRLPIAMEPVAITTTMLSLTDHTKPSEGEDPLQNAVKSDTAVIGGVIGVTVFVVLCLLAISGRLLYQRKGAYRESQSKAAEYSETADPTPNNRPNYQDPMNDGRREFFI